jgi:recombination protein RecR
MDSFHKLVQLFREFPGIGPRQAERFAYFLLNKPASFGTTLSQAISDVKNSMTVCSECGRHFVKKHQQAASMCSICGNPNRTHETLMLVSRDVDLEALERSGIYSGVYFVLGGIVPILEKEPEKRIRINALEERIKRDGSAGVLKEIIYALNANPDGEHTVEFIGKRITPLVQQFSIKTSLLGRGLSTGTEIEYSDPETLKNALTHRIS